MNEGANPTEPWLVEDLGEVPEELQGLCIKIRHGFGIQVYEAGKARYAGDWLMNQRTGDGHMVYEDGSEYKGKLVEGLRQGLGYFKWPPVREDEDSEDCLKKMGHQYVGHWHSDMMHGEGKFQHVSGFVFAPTFLRNMALIPGTDTFVAPYMNEMQCAELIKKIKQRDADDAAKLLSARQAVSLHRVNGIEQCRLACDAIRNKHRTPVVLTLHENPVEVGELARLLELEGEFYDLRSMAVGEESRRKDWLASEESRRNSALAQRERFDEGSYESLQDEFKELERERLNQKLRNLEPFVRHLVLDNDEPTIKWSHLYDPELAKVLFGKTGLPMQLWQAQSFFSAVDQAPQTVRDALDELYDYEFAR